MYYPYPIIYYLASQATTDTAAPFPSSSRMSQMAVDPQASCEIQDIIEHGLQETARARVALARFSLRNNPLRTANQSWQSWRDGSAQALSATTAQSAEQTPARFSTQLGNQELLRLLNEALAARRVVEERVRSLQAALEMKEFATPLGDDRDE